MLKRDHQLVLPTQARAPGFRVELKGTTFRLVATGAWTVAEATQLDRALKRLRVPIPPTPDFTGEMDIAGIAEIDTAGALLLQRTAAAWEKSGLRTRYAGATESFRILIEEVQEQGPSRAAADREAQRAPVLHRGHGQDADRGVDATPSSSPAFSARSPPRSSACSASRGASAPPRSFITSTMPASGRCRSSR